MIVCALREEGLNDRCYTIPVEDINENALWVSRVLSYCPKFDVVYSNNPLVKELFENIRIEVKKSVSKNGTIEACKIRETIMKEEPWESYVPKAVASYLKSINAAKRLRAIVEEEKKQ